MSENLGVAVVREIDFALVSKEALVGDLCSGQRHVIAFPAPAELYAILADASVEDVEALRRGEQALRSPDAFPRFHGAADENEIVKDLSFNAQFLGEGALRGEVERFDRRIDILHLIAHCPYRNHVRECKPCHEEPPCRKSIMTQGLT